MDTVRKGKQRRAKLDFKVLNDAKLKIRKLTESVGIDFKYKAHGYPHFYYIDDIPSPSGRGARGEGSTSAVYELTVIECGRCWILLSRRI